MNEMSKYVKRQEPNAKEMTKELWKPMQNVIYYEAYVIYNAYDKLLVWLGKKAWQVWLKAVQCCYRSSNKAMQKGHG